MNLPEGLIKNQQNPLYRKEEGCIYTLRETPCYNCGMCTGKINTCVLNEYICNNCGFCQGI